MNIELSNKTILVTGGAGFIGSNLCESLLEKENKVVCFDNFATGKKENIEQFVDDSNFVLISESMMIFPSMSIFSSRFSAFISKTTSVEP